VIPGLPDRPAAGRAAALGLGAVALCVAVAGGGELGGAAARALAVVLLLGAGLLALRRRPPGAAGAPALLVERHALGKDAGVALLSAGRRRLLLGYGPSGVSLLAELDGAAPEVRP
jgi:hypothetical protein